MNRPLALPFRASLALAAVAATSLAAAQEPPSGPSGGNGEGPGPSVTVVQLPPPATPGPAAPSYPGALPSPGFNPDAHLPSSSRSTTDASRSTDGFDLGSKGGGPDSVRGSAGGSYVVEGQFVPQAHTVHRGETLWEISGRFYSNPYRWPQLWAQNPQIQNPHWIYPGDRVRLRDPGSSSVNNIGLNRSGRVVPPQTIFLREVGWVDDRKDDAWGEVVGSPADQMLLGEGNDVYIQLDDNHEVALGQQLTLFRPIRTVASDSASGTLVSIRGTARVDRYNPKTHTLRAKVVEALDVIERGCLVGPVGRRFDMVPPITSDVDMEATLLASVYPNQVFGQNQVIFLDKGDRAGVKAGMRFFLMQRGDRWQRAIRNAGPMAAKRARVEDDRPAQVDGMPTTIDEEVLPEETYGEVRVLSVREHTAAALVTAARHEIERNARLVARKGL